MDTLTKRARSVLYAVVTEFIATGEPVGSRTLAKKYGFDLSAATIRNVLADLEDSGYLQQPHTSAGRVPTSAAFRLFIDALMRVRQISTHDAAKIAEWFEDLAPGSDILRETGKLLSELTGVPAVLARPRIETRTLLKVRFIPTKPGELLSVLVLSDGTVENRFISVDKPLSESELERLHNMLEDVAEGRTLAAIREHFANTAKERRDQLALLNELGVSLFSAAIEGGGRSTDVLIEGQSLLLDNPEFSDANHMRDLMRTLQDRERLVLLLDRTLASSRVQVFLGDETSEAMGSPVSLVAAPYRDSQGVPSGAVGIIGPTRMDYPGLIPLVGATAEAMSTALARHRDQRSPRKGDRDDEDG